MNLNTRIQLVKGVGPKMGEKLNKLGVETISDVIFYYPRNYIDFTDQTQIKDLQSYENRRGIAEGAKFTIRGRIAEIANKKTSRRKFTITEAVVEDGTGSLKVVWFNQPFLLKMLPVGREVILNGKIAYNFYSKEVVMESPLRAASPTIVPVYGETAGITSKYISKLVESIKYQVESIEEWLPEEIRNPKSEIRNKSELSNDQSSKRSNYPAIQLSNQLIGIQDALLNIHFPKNREELKSARRRIAFDELFMIALRAGLTKEEIKKENAPVISTDDKKIAYATFLSSFSFKLTGDQKKAVDQILDDMKKSVPMNRLLNGDVGSGKTAVAAVAAYAAVKAGYRVAVMCPTSILASQHYETFCKFFNDFDISVGLFTRERKECFSARHPEFISGSQAQKMLEQTQIPKQVRDDKNEVLNSDIVIGTQALIQEGVDLENLGLVIVDEQHRFGVAQRQALKQFGVGGRESGEKTPHAPRLAPHFLSMTATPIPRTLHLALFGDLDISVIKEKPANRKEIKTRFVESGNRQKAYEFIRAHIKAGRQAFVICPLIESKVGGVGGGESLEFEDERKTVTTEYEKLQKVFPEYSIGMLHGKMKPKEKDSVMADFCANKTQILVSTSVVEVGVDVPNATVMVIEDAERFGLAQIHQFRGRVGRADHQSFCFLFSPTMSEKAIKRLRALEDTSDGFKLSEIDLETRGPGAVFGTEQSGLLDLKMASFSDSKLIEEASSAAKSIIAEDPDLKNHISLKEKVADYLENKHLE